MTDSLGGRVAPAAHREFGHAMVHVTSPEAALFASLPDELRVWASHGDYVEAAPDGFAVVATSANAPVAAMQDRLAPPLRPAVPSRSRAHRPRARDPAELRVRRLRLHRRLDDGLVHRRGDGADPRAGGRGAGHLRAQRRRGLDGRRGDHPSRHRRSAHVRVRRQRRAAPQRGDADPAPVRREAEAAARVRGRRRSVHRQARRRHRPRAQAQDHRADLHRGLRGEGQQPRDVRLPRAGHALSRRHRVGLGGRARRRPSRATTTSAACPRR